jgi:hypothetical protein
MGSNTFDVRANKARGIARATSFLAFSLGLHSWTARPRVAAEAYPPYRVLLRKDLLH